MLAVWFSALATTNRTLKTKISKTLKSRRRLNKPAINKPMRVAAKAKRNANAPTPPAKKTAARIANVKNVLASAKKARSAARTHATAKSATVRIASAKRVRIAPARTAKARPAKMLAKNLAKRRNSSFTYYHLKVA